MMLYATPGAHIDGAPIVNGITVLAKTAEMFVKMRFSVSRRSNFAKPPEKALNEFLEQG
jgi:allantoin racemase